jgi:LPXTG-motif cell wall-anchored protein
VAEHAQTVHGVEVTPELIEQVKSLVHEDEQTKEEVKMKTRLMGITMLVLAILAVSGVLYAQEVLQPGDSIDGMSLRSGGSQGPPIWAFCAAAFPNPGVTTTECTVPPLPELAIGHGGYGADEARRDAMWNVQTWELYLDGQQVDLDAFGTFDADLPLGPGQPGYDPNQEVIAKLRSWDVVLVGPTAGAHTLRSVVHFSQDADDGFHTMAAGTYELVVNFTVAAPALPETGGSTPTGTPLWIGAGGMLVLIAGLGLRRGLRRTR